MKNQIVFISYVVMSVSMAVLWLMVGVSCGKIENLSVDDRFKTREYEFQHAGVAAPEEKIVTWGSPTPQSHGDTWLFDVFTPPKIYVHPKTGEFTAVPYKEETVPQLKPENKKPPFGVAFTSLYQQPFHIILRSLILSPDGDSSKSFIQLEVLQFAKPAPGMSQAKVVGKKTLTGSVGKYFVEEKIKIANLVSERVVTETGLPETLITLTVQDLSSGISYSLRQNQVVMTPNQWVTLRSTIVPSKEWLQINPAPGMSFKMNDAIYSIVNVDLSARSISLHKEYSFTRRAGESPEQVVENEILNLASVGATRLPGSPPLPGDPSAPSISPPPSVPGTAPDKPADKTGPPLPGAIPSPSPAPGTLPLPSAPGIPLPGTAPSVLPLPGIPPPKAVPDPPVAPAPFRPPQ